MFIFIINEMPGLSQLDKEKMKICYFTWHWYLLNSGKHFNSVDYISSRSRYGSAQSNYKLHLSEWKYDWQISTVILRSSIKMTVEVWDWTPFRQKQSKNSGWPSVKMLVSDFLYKDIKCIVCFNHPWWSLIKIQK